VDHPTAAPPVRKQETHLSADNADEHGSIPLSEQWARSGLGALCDLGVKKSGSVPFLSGSAQSAEKKISAQIAGPLAKRARLATG
jgi:hypothetical protein